MSRKNYVWKASCMVTHRSSGALQTELIDVHEFSDPKWSVIRYQIGAMMKRETDSVFVAGPVKMQADQFIVNRVLFSISITRQESADATDR